MQLKLSQPIPTSIKRESIQDRQIVLELDDGDDDLRLQVSIFSDASEPDRELVNDVIDVLRAYGFSDVLESYEAPGSWFAKVKAKFHNQRKDEAQHSKAELSKDLKSDKPPRSPGKRKAVGKLKKRLKGAKKKAVTWIMAGATMLGSAAGGAAKDIAKDWIKNEIPKVEQKVEQEASKAAHKVRGYFVVDVLPEEAIKFHQAVDRKIAISPDKKNVPPPPPETGSNPTKKK
jgi:hypothetical protein